MNTIDYAIAMEKDGHDYYLEQAELNKGNELEKVFLFLAKEEQSHYDLLVRRKNSETVTYHDSTLMDLKNVFSDLESIPQNKEKQLDVYRIAYGLEEKSIHLYFDLLTKTTDPVNQKLYTFLIHQEQQHMKLFEDLVIMLSRPEEWVESAEFGVREEY